MTTPARIPELEPTQPTGPVPVAAPFGWMLMLGGAIGLLFASWVLYGRDAHSMWAGYRDLTFATVVIVCALSLRSSLAAKPAIGVAALSGLALILLGVFAADHTVIQISEIVGGAVILFGALLNGSDAD